MLICVCQPQAVERFHTHPSVTGSDEAISVGLSIILRVCPFFKDLHNHKYLLYIWIFKVHDKACSYTRKDHVEARPPGRPRLPKLGSEDESSAQRPCGPEVPPLCHASRLVGDQRGYSDTQPLMGPSACLFL